MSGFIIDDTPPHSPVCSLCVNQDREKERSCRAFKKEKGIPDEIWLGENNHTLPVRGDHGIRFEPIKKEEERR